MKKKSLLIFHSVIAPYRIDFFNDLNILFKTKTYLFYGRYKSQNFDVTQIRKRLMFQPEILKKGIELFGRPIRFGILSKLKKHKPDVVLTLEYSFITLFISIFKDIFGFKFKIVSICDDSLDIAESCRGPRLWARNYLLKKIDGLILCNEGVKRWYGDNFPNVSLFNFPIIQNDSSFRKRLYQSITISNRYITQYGLYGKKVVLYVGRLVAVKNLELLIKAFNKLPNTNGDSVLVIVGEGNQREKLIELVEKKNMQELVIFTGRFDGDELLAWYNIGSLFVLPSYYEPFGSVVGEALIGGMPALVSKYAGASDIIENANGRVIELEEEQLSEYINHYLGKSEKIENIEDIRASLLPFTYKQQISNLVEWLENDV